VHELGLLAESEARLVRFSETPFASEWLQQFPDGTAIVAARKNDAMTFMRGD
jgi:hypothetical protein